jgi:competence protein ComEA
MAALTRPAPDGWAPATPVEPDLPPVEPDLPPAEPDPPAEPERPPDGPSRHRAAAADRVPPGLRAALVAPAGRAVAGLLLLVLLAVGVALVATWLSRPRAEPVPARARPVGAPLSMAPSAAVSPTGVASPTGGVSSTGAVPIGPAVVVHVVGAVRRPGLVELPAGSRVADAVDAAGGVTRAARTASVNLARLLVDGEQVVVLRRGEDGAAGPLPGPVASGGTGAAPAGGATGPVNLNTASLEQLDSLPGIGPVLAQRILDWRTAHGRFTAVDELGEVSGIGEATLADLRELVTV